jgi:metal-responsive CopG/Arc/MetJ family transcriptional regulator
MENQNDNKQEKPNKKKIVVSVNESLFKQANKRWPELGFSSQSEYINHLIRMDLFSLGRE